MKERKVERIDSSMVGMEARKMQWTTWETILAIDEGFFFSRDNQHRFHFVRSVDGDWLIRDPKEKEKIPSQRLSEFVIQKDSDIYYRKEMWDILDEHSERIAKLEEK